MPLRSGAGGARGPAGANDEPIKTALPPRSGDPERYAPAALLPPPPPLLRLLPGAWGASKRPREESPPPLLALLLALLSSSSSLSSLKEKGAATAEGLRTVRFTVARVSSEGVATTFSTPAAAFGKSVGICDDEEEEDEDDA